MLTTLMLSDDELSPLTNLEKLALEYLMHERLSDLARRRRSGDGALMFAIRAARYLDPMIAEIGADGTEALLADVRASGVGQAALARATEAAAFAEVSAAA